MAAETVIKKPLEQVLQGQALTRDDILQLLSLEDPGDMEQLFRAARQVRQQHFGRRVFMYGFVYFSNHCHNDCHFCYARKSNTIRRYRKSHGEVIEIAEKLASSGVHLIDLTMGEDEAYLEGEALLNLAVDVKNATGLPVMASPGVLSHQQIDRLAERQVEWFALYQETHNRQLYSRLRSQQDYDRRMKAKTHARDAGMLIEEGLLVGVGESLADLADSILAMKAMGASQVRAMSFVPQKGTPLETLEEPARIRELKTMAVMRLVMPEALIPASLDVDGIGGLKDRLAAGANVVTSIIPPLEGIGGVAQETRDVDDGLRSAEQVRALLEDVGLQAATQADYQAYLAKKQPGIRRRGA